MKTTNDKYKKYDITNIDPIKGVTPEQLLNWCNKAVFAFKQSFGLDDHAKQTAINNTVIKCYADMQSGKVPTKHFEDFGGYLVVGLRQNILNQLQAVKRSNNTSYIIDDDNYSFDQPTTNQQEGFTDEQLIQLNKLKEALTKLNNPTKEAMMKEFLSQPDYIYGDKKRLTKKYGFSESTFNWVVEQLKKIITEGHTTNKGYICTTHNKLTIITDADIKHTEALQGLKAKIQYLYSQGYKMAAIAKQLDKAYSVVRYHVYPSKRKSKKQK